MLLSIWKDSISVRQPSTLTIAFATVADVAAGTADADGTASNAAAAISAVSLFFINNLVSFVFLLLFSGFNLYYTRKSSSLKKYTRAPVTMS